MTLSSDAAMMLFYDIKGDTRDHDEWHSYEHFHERLSVPGFIRATRWVAVDARPRYMVMYEVEDLGVATSHAYLHRLNNPTPWTMEMMPRFSGMVRGFSSIIGGYGFGLGSHAFVVRFVPNKGSEKDLSDTMAGQLLPELASTRGIVGCHFLEPAPAPPMTNEQSLRGPDRELPWLLLVFAYDPKAVMRADLEPQFVNLLGPSVVEGSMVTGYYALGYSATNLEVGRSKPPLVQLPALRGNVTPGH